MKKITKEEILRNKHLIMPGFNAVFEVLKAKPKALKLIAFDTTLLKKSLDELTSLATSSGLELRSVDNNDFKDVFKEDSSNREAKHQGVFALVSENEISIEEISQNLEKSKNKTILLLDRINDNQNLGAIFRLAAAVGVSAVILTKDSSAKITPVVRRISMGGTELIPYLRVSNLSRVIEQLKEQNIWVYGAASETSLENLPENHLPKDLAVTSAFKTDFPEKVAIVLGSESDGLRRLTMKSCDALVSLPHFGYLESLNVSQAASVLLYEVMRQQTSKST